MGPRLKSDQPTKYLNLAHEACAGEFVVRIYRAYRSPSFFTFSVFRKQLNFVNNFFNLFKI